MASGMFVDLIPDFNQLESDLEQKDLKKEVKVESDEDGDGFLDGLLGGGGGKEGGLLGGTGGMIAKLSALIGAVMLIVKAVSGLPQMQAIMKMINTVIQLALLPFINMLFTFLKPILIKLIKLMPLWLAFWRNPVQNLMALAEWVGVKIGEFFNQLPGMIADGLAALPGLIGGFFEKEGRRLQQNPMQYITNRAKWPILGLSAPLWEAMLPGIGRGAQGEGMQRSFDLEQTVNVNGLSEEATSNKIQSNLRRNPFGE